MQEVAEEFGVALEALGPRVPRADAWRPTRKRSGMRSISWRAAASDVGTILTGMKDEIKTLVNDVDQVRHEDPREHAAVDSRN